MIRQANVKDKKELEQIFIKASLGGYGIAPYRNERISRLLFTYFINNLSKTVFATVFEEENIIVSTAMLSVKEQVTDKHINKKLFVGILHSVYTQEEYRRKGYARQTVIELVNIAANLKVQLEYIELTAISDIAVELYLQCGFSLIDAQRKYMRRYL